MAFFRVGKSVISTFYILYLTTGTGCVLYITFFSVGRSAISTFYILYLTTGTGCVLCIRMGTDYVWYLAKCTEDCVISLRIGTGDEL